MEIFQIIAIAELFSMIILALLLLLSCSSNDGRIPMKPSEPGIPAADPCRTAYINGCAGAADFDPIYSMATKQLTCPGSKLFQGDGTPLSESLACLCSDVALLECINDKFYYVQAGTPYIVPDGVKLTCA